MHPVWSETVGSMWNTGPLSPAQAQDEGCQSHGALGSCQGLWALLLRVQPSVLFPSLTSQELTEPEIGAVLLKMGLLLTLPLHHVKYHSPETMKAWGPSTIKPLGYSEKNFANINKSHYPTI